MKYFIAAAAVAVVAGVTSQVVAADLIIEEPAMIVADPTFDWTGPYVGARIGWVGGEESDDLRTQIVTRLDNTADSFDMDGWIAGIYAGHNWQSGNLVFGIEGSLDATNLSGSADFNYYQELYGTLSLDSDWQAAIRGRVGVAIDRALIYATAGLAGANATMTASYQSSTFSDSNFHTGLTAGVGVEYAFTDNLVGRAAIDFTAFGEQTYDLGGPFLPTDASWTQTAATIGLALKF